MLHFFDIIALRLRFVNEVLSFLVKKLSAVDAMEKSPQREAAAEEEAETKGELVWE